MKSFRVSREDLAKFGDVLTPGRYREQKAEAVDHDPPDEIIAEILKAEDDITERLRNLRKQLAKK